MGSNQNTCLAPALACHVYFPRSWMQCAFGESTLVFGKKIHKWRYESWREWSRIYSSSAKLQLSFITSVARRTHVLSLKNIFERKLH